MPGRSARNPNIETPEPVPVRDGAPSEVPAQRTRPLALTAPIVTPGEEIPVRDGSPEPNLLQVQNYYFVPERVADNAEDVASFLHVEQADRDPPRPGNSTAIALVAPVPRPMPAPLPPLPPELVQGTSYRSRHMEPIVPDHMVLPVLERQTPRVYLYGNDEYADFESDHELDIGLAGDDAGNHLIPERDSVQADPSIIRERRDPLRHARLQQSSRYEQAERDYNPDDPTQSEEPTHDTDDPPAEQPPAEHPQ